MKLGAVPIGHRAKLPDGRLVRVMTRIKGTPLVRPIMLDAQANENEGDLELIDENTEVEKGW